MRKIFVFWIIFVIILIAGIILAISSKTVLRREERRAEELRNTVIPRRSLPISRTPAVGEVIPEKPKPEVQVIPEKPKPAADVIPKKSEGSSLSGEIQPLQDIPVQINTNSLEVVMPVSSGGSTALTAPVNPPEQPVGSEAEPSQGGESLNSSQGEEPSQVPPAAE